MYSAETSMSLISRLSAFCIGSIAAISDWPAVGEVGVVDERHDRHDAEGVGQRPGLALDRPRPPGVPRELVLLDPVREVEGGEPTPVRGRPAAERRGAGERVVVVPGDRELVGHVRPDPGRAVGPGVDRDRAPALDERLAVGAQVPGVELVRLPEGPRLAVAGAPVDPEAR